jgi:hypothetical protein
MAVISKVLLQTHQETNIPTILKGDNQGIQHICKLEFKAATNRHQVITEWVPGHQDNDKQQTVNDMENVKLSNSTIMNTLCDQTANKMVMYVPMKDGLCLRWSGLEKVLRSQ